MLAAHPGHRVEHAPAVAVELGEGVQIDVTVVHTHVPAEDRRVQPDVAVGQLHPLRASRGAGGVVDGGRRVLVALPGLGLDVELHEDRIALGADRPLHLALDVGHRRFEFGVDEQDPSPAVLDDVLDLLGDESEVDRHQDATRARHTEQGGEQPGGVVRHHRDAFALSYSEGVEPGRHRLGAAGHLAVRDRAPRFGRLIGFVDDRHAIGVEQLGAADEIVDGQRNLHGCAD